MKGRWWVLAVACVAVGATTYAVTTAPAGPRSLRAFDPDRTAALELEMWQAYYAKERVRLFRLLVTMLREQYRYPWSTAAIEGFHLARAAATFGDATSQYERVLPDLEKGYATARQWVGAGFDPGRVARAELAWWVARRTKGEDDPEHVGRLIAEAYALLYEAPFDDMLKPGLLRAEAAAMRDAQAAAPDWASIGGLLKDSYRQLHGNLSRAAAD